MFVRNVDTHIRRALDYHAQNLAKTTELDCCVLSYVGQIHPAFLQNYLETIEDLAAKRDASPSPITYPERIAIILSTPGGIVETVEKMVEIVRHHFKEVFFIVPSQAMSAGTIFCMSGDKIFMDYSSSLGPIDPQVQNPEGRFVPALGYIDKVEELITKSRNGLITDAELVMLKMLDLATLRRFEQARDLSCSLLKDWLVRFKFKDWTKHRSTNPGTDVSPEEKHKRAEEIAQCLSDNKTWHSHGRLIGIDKLRRALKLEIEDYTENIDFRRCVRTYSDLLEEYVQQQQLPFFMHISTGGDIHG